MNLHLNEIMATFYGALVDFTKAFDAVQYAVVRRRGHSSHDLGLTRDEMLSLMDGWLIRSRVRSMIRQADKPPKVASRSLIGSQTGSILLIAISVHHQFTR